ncbi:MAG: hypothetical protein K2Y37_21765 [Pirellulales bacterium]|nr:hypothetical protein [Pirellulales bacterium]
MLPLSYSTITGTVRGVARPESVVCRAFPELTSQAASDNVARFEFARQNFQPSAPLDIEFPLAEPREPTVRSYAAEALPQRAAARTNEAGDVFEEDRDNRDPADPWQDPWAGRRANYFLATLPALAAPRPAETEPPADVLILADTSGATAPQESVRQAVRTVVGFLRSTDRFRLACADVALRPLGDEWLAPDTPAARESLQRFEQQVFLGASDLAEVLLGAARVFDEAPATAEPPAAKSKQQPAARRRLVVYVGDGVDTSGEVTPRELANQVASRLKGTGAKFVAAIVRDDSRGYEHLDLLARQTGGTLLSAPGGAIDNHELLRWMLAGLPSPRQIVSVRVTGADPADVFYPATWPVGRGLPIYGRLRGDASQIEIALTTQRDGREQTDKYKLPLPADGDDLFIGRLWAQERLDHLRRQQAASQFANRALDQEMLGLSQQWTLLSPLTAFLVLESEKDYVRWDIDRRQRRRYWRPAEAVGDKPLPEDWLARVRPAPKPDPLADPAVIERALASARRALADGHTRLALTELERIHRSPLVPKMPEYAQLVELSRQASLREAALAMLGPARVLVDRGSVVYREPAVLQLARPAAGLFPAEFLERHPHAVQLLQDVSFPSTEITLSQLARLLRDLTKANVDLDVAAIDEAGAAPDTPLSFSGFGKFALRDFVRNLLMSHDLVLMDEPDQLIITTTEEAQNRMQTEVYPVADLLLTDRVASFDQLIDPYADHQSASEAHIRQRLTTPIPVNFTETPLTDVAWSFAEQLKIPVVLDTASLDDAGIGSDTPITIHREAMPARDALRWCLGEHELTYVLANGAMLITTLEEAQNLLPTRLHSGIGLVAEYPVSNRLPGGFDNRFMGQGMLGMGGLGGMMGGGMGGLGGMPGGMAMSMTTGGDQASAQSTDGNLQLGAVESNPPAAGAPKPETPAAPAPPAAGAEPGSVVVPEGRADEPPPPVRYVADFDSMIDNITSTVQPTTWEEVGGQGAIDFHRPTLDLVVTGTEDVHEHIESLFTKLRKLPPVGIGRFGMRLAEPKPLTEDADQLIDFDSLIDMITMHCSPTSWEEVGGQGSIESDRLRLALIFSQTPDVHDQAARLLMLLRRSRFEQLFGTRPWESAAGSGGMLASGWLLDGDGATRQVGELPEPKPEELAALSIRRELREGEISWRRVPVDAPADTASAETFTLGVHEGRSRFNQVDRALVIDGESVAAVYPAFDLIELGPWALTARDTIDAWLPWLPHRTNDELARRFEIIVVPPAAGDEPAAPDAERKRKLRLAFPGQSSSIYLEATFSEMHGLPVSWEAIVDGQVVQRLRFAEFKPTPAGPQWHQITLEDAAGKQLARWELVDAKNQVDVPRLGALDDDAQLGSLTRLDRRAAAQPRAADLESAVSALQRREWDAAVAALDKVLVATPDRPLPLFLKAWCQDQQAQPPLSEPVVAALSTIAASPAVELTRLIASGTPGFLSAAERYQVLSAQPESQRSHDDWAHLAHWAMEAGKREEALAHIERSLDEKEITPAYRFARELLRVEIFLSLDRGELVGQYVAALVDNRQAMPDQLSHVADLLVHFGRRDDAEKLFTAALAREGLPADQRYGLLVARSACQVGLARWRTLLEAELSLPGDAPQLGVALASVLGELHQPIDAEVAAQLAAAFDQPRVRWPLVMRQAELTVDAAAAGELWWRAYQSGHLADDKLLAACVAMNDGGRSDRVVEVVEAKIRARHRTAPHLLAVLETAYRRQGRAADARRAATNFQEQSAEERWQQSLGNRSARRETGRGAGMSGMGMF